MTTKRRPLQRKRIGIAAEADAWHVKFETGHDFFHDLPKFGIPDDADVREAWRRLGAIHMATRTEGEFNVEQPWALQEFGEP